MSFKESKFVFHFYFIIYYLHHYLTRKEESLSLSLFKFAFLYINIEYFILFEDEREEKLIKHK